MKQNEILWVTKREVGATPFWLKFKWPPLRNDVFVGHLAICVCGQPCFLSKVLGWPLEIFKRSETTTTWTMLCGGLWWTRLEILAKTFACGAPCHPLCWQQHSFEPNYPMDLASRHCKLPMWDWCSIWHGGSCTRELEEIGTNGVQNNFSETKEGNLQQLQQHRHLWPLLQWIESWRWPKS